ncbi:hypothetical protein [Nocardioides sediminis]|uniref:hypothetical protein n=1 Tax=Nocardioides sediminis TaxID=433648 RepID=UPI00131F32BA|nr:hypothetical protein [Nocardioides sediminis]
MPTHVPRAPRRSAPVMLLAALLVLTGAPALADSASVRDGTGDMWTVREGETDGQHAPGARIGDIARTTYTHTETRVVVRARFVELTPVGRRFTLWVGMRSRDGRETTLGVRASRRDRDGHTVLMDERGRDIDCVVRHRISYGRDVVSVAVPRACLRRPAALRFNALSEQWGRRLFYANLDDGLSPNVPGPVRWTSPVRAG